MGAQLLIMLKIHQTYIYWVDNSSKGIANTKFHNKLTVLPKSTNSHIQFNNRGVKAAIGRSLVSQSSDQSVIPTWNALAT